MSRQFRYRITAIVLGGLLLGGPLLINGTASAEQTAATGPAAAGTRQVTFAGGGMLALACRSSPDVESMVVPAGSTIRVVNRTGHDARLELGGTSKGMVADDASTDVVFRRGTTAVQVRPTCALGEDATPVLVTVSPSPSAGPATTGPVPSPTNTASSDSTAGPGDSVGSPSATRPAAVPPTARPSWPAANPGRPAVLRPGPRRTTAVVHAGSDATPPSLRSTTVSGTRGSALPASSDPPPGERRATLPGASGLDVSPATSDVAPVPPAVGPAGPSAAQMAAAEPMAAMEPIPSRGPVGLLGLIAAVCVLGVGIAAIRAIVSQRANRSRMA